MSAPAEGDGDELFGASGALDGALIAGASARVASASSIRIGDPFETLSPTLTTSLATFPAVGDGISMVALSDSSVMSDCSLLIESPGLTSTSMTSTSLKSPMSGTLTSVLVIEKRV